MDWHDIYPEPDDRGESEARAEHADKYDAEYPDAGTLNPCPFCGEAQPCEDDQASVGLRVVVTQLLAYVNCQTCGTDGPISHDYRPSASDAVHLWNVGPGGRSLRASADRTKALEAAGFALSAEPVGYTLVAVPPAYEDLVVTVGEYLDAHTAAEAGEQSHSGIRIMLARLHKAFARVAEAEAASSAGAGDDQ